MASTDAKTSSAPGAPGVSPDGGGRGGWWAGVRPREVVRPAVIAGLLVFVLFGLPSWFSLYYIDASTQVAIYAIVTLGLGLLVGRVGMVSLGQAAVLSLGAWVAARLLFATSLPFEVVLVLAGVITMVLGTLVGLPALRLSGLYLALITLMLAGAITVVLATTNFPNGGHGFLGYNLGVSVDWLTILFGIGVLQVLSTAPAGIVEQFPKDMARLGGLIARLWRRDPDSVQSASGR